ncbi:Colicin V production protein [Brevinema andersonii]|uniref:Colicin V production protein n=1 Tax=Brevinema andersonii TaxID=34097 RepID=A0A1I1DTH2_BREAD|nr:CvpA family protein [Brevinema andersonii]SFB78181.1 Colicin V production protein [Brevinema andersonii]
MEAFIEYITITVLIIGAILGAIKGFTALFFSWFGLIGGVIFSHQFSLGLMYRLLPQYTHSKMYIILFAVFVFIVIYILAAMLGHFVSRVIYTFQLSFLNHILGVVLGTIQAMLIIGFFIGLLNYYGWINAPSMPVTKFVSYWATQTFHLLRSVVSMLTQC